MKNLLSLIGLAVVLVGGVGWYLGWYKLGTEPTGNGHTKITADVDTTEITNDLKKAKKKIGEVIHDTNNPTGGIPPERPVEGTSTGLRFGTDGSATIVLPKLPALPSFTPPDQIDPNTTKVVLPPPPPSFGPGQ